MTLIMTVAKAVPEHQTTTNQQPYKSAKHVVEESSSLSKKEVHVWKKEGNQSQSFIPSDVSMDQHIFTFDHEKNKRAKVATKCLAKQIKVVQENVMGREPQDQMILDFFHIAQSPLTSMCLWAIAWDLSAI